MDYNALIKKALESGIEEIELYVKTNVETTISLYNKEVEQFQKSNTHVLSARGVYKGKMGYVGLENLKEEKSDFIIDEIKKSASTLTTNDPFIIYKGSKEYQKIDDTNPDFDMHSSLEKIALLKSLEEKIKVLDPRIVSVAGCDYSEAYQKIELINSKGLNLVKDSTKAYIIGQAVAKENDSVKDGYSYQIVKQFKEFDVDKCAQEVVNKCIRGLNATSIKSNKQRVMFTNEMTSSLLGAFSSIFSGSAVLKNLTLLKDKLNTKVFGDNINIFDDPFNCESPFQEPFDDEGVACFKKAVVLNGELKLFLQNLQTAKKLGVEPTGNGFKEGESIDIRPCNLYLEPGDLSYDEMIKKLDNGVVITSLQGLHAGLNAISGDFSLQASGLFVKDGVVDHAVTLFVVAGNIMNLLNNVLFIGNDFKFSINGIGASSIIVNELMISGD